jgi:hypothetical protein
MSPTDLDPRDEVWWAAERALKLAQQMPVGPERIAALKRAGQLRFDAYQKARPDRDLIDRHSIERLRRGRPRE